MVLCMILAGKSRDFGGIEGIPDSCGYYWDNPRSNNNLSGNAAQAGFTDLCSALPPITQQPSPPEDFVLKELTGNKFIQQMPVASY